MSLIVVLPLLAGAQPPQIVPGSAPASQVAVATKTIRLDGPAEVMLEVTAACRGGSWARAGHEGAVLRVTVDGRSSQHLVLSRGAEPAPYRIVLGALDAGAHQAALFVEQGNCGASPGAVVVEDIVANVVPPGTAEHRALAHTPFIHARAGTVARFSDIPLLMWYATEPSPRGTWIRYSVIFSNEDGGTPADRLMATWGRLTDIEYVYGVELDAAGQILAAEYQGTDHKFLPFAGERVGQHPVLYVVTENNMVSDRGVASERFALAPIPFEIEERSREVVMDTHPWLYRVSSEEAMREARVEAFPQPGRGKVPDPRRFVYVEACGHGENATVAFDAGFAGDGGTLQWAASDGGGTDFRVSLGGSRQGTERPGGCFRAAVAAPPDAGPLRALRWRAYPKPPSKDEPPPPPETVRARLTRVIRVFQLDDNFVPGPNLFTSNREVELPIGGTPTEVAIVR
jgi:hypothetical protein